MEEKIILISKNNVDEVNEELKKGWKVKMITPFSQTISVTGSCYHSETGNYGAYVVLERILI